MLEKSQKIKGVLVEITNTQAKANNKRMMKWLIKHQILNNKKKQQVLDKERRRGKVEEPKYSDSEQQGKDNKTYNFRYTSTRAKIETKKRGKGIQHKFMAQENSSDINDRDICPLCNRPVRTGVECGICCVWFHYRSEGTTKERVVKKIPTGTILHM